MSSAVLLTKMTAVDRLAFPADMCNVTCW